MTPAPASSLALVCTWTGSSSIGMNGSSTTTSLIRRLSAKRSAHFPQLEWPVSQLASQAYRSHYRRHHSLAEKEPLARHFSPGRASSPPHHSSLRLDSLALRLAQSFSATPPHAIRPMQSAARFAPLCRTSSPSRKARLARRSTQTPLEFASSSGLQPELVPAVRNSPTCTPKPALVTGPATPSASALSSSKSAPPPVAANPLCS